MSTETQEHRGGRQARPLLHARVDLVDDAVQTLPGLKEVTATGYPIGFTLIRVRGSGGITWRDDGGDPSAYDGMPCDCREEERYDGDPANFKFVRRGFGTTVCVAYYAAPVPA